MIRRSPNSSHPEGFRRWRSGADRETSSGLSREADFKSLWRRWVKTAGGADLRSLALLRISYGFLILSDLLIRATGLTAHYTDQGVLPRELLYRIGHPFDYSIHALGGTTASVACVFILNAVAAGALLLGWKTRWATLVCWVMMVSLHNRNFALQNGGDNWMSLVLFWALFLPWGEKWSVDSWGRQATPNELPPTPATWGLAYQIFIVYWVAGIFKTGPTWWVDGTAIQFSLQLNQWSGKWAHLPLMFPEVLRLMTFAILFFELFGPPLFFSPWRTGPVRTLMVLCFMSFHLGLGIFLEIGLFPWVGLLTVASLFPTWAWKRRPWRWLEALLDRVWGGLECRFGKKLKGDEQRLELSRSERWLLNFCLLYITIWCGATFSQRIWLPPQARIPGYFFALDQYWALFAPRHPRPSRLAGRRRCARRRNLGGSLLGRGASLGRPLILQ